MSLRTLELCALKYANLILQFFFQLPDFTKVKLGLLTDSDILLMVEKDIKEGICHSIYEYAKANNKLMKDYDKNEESSYLQYWHMDNLYR